MAELEIPGVPERLASDAWWLGERSPAEDCPQSDASTGMTVAAFTLAGLIALADFLFWKQPVGLSLVMFSAALSGAAILSLRPKLSRKSASLVAGFWVVTTLPVIEFVQPVSVLFLVVGHFAVLAYLATRARSGVLLGQTLLLLPLMLRFLIPHLATVLSRPRLPSAKAPATSAALAWMLPGGMGLVFVGLFLQANPLLERWAVELASTNPWPDFALRVAFWGVVLFAGLPFVLFKAFASDLRASRGICIAPPDLEGRLFNAWSVTNSLLLFNALFLMQNLSDLAVLWVGLSLPVGMTYADYAHQGAYPLMVTAVLSGVFAVLSQRYVDRAPLLRVLLLVWIAQNVVLAASALGRLDLYMYAYGLTYLRLRAAIGMGLVILGMCLLGWQLWRGHATGWTIRRFAGLVLATLYLGSFVNFGHIIVATNLARDNQHPVDYAYLCSATGLAATALRADGLCRFSKYDMPVAPRGWRDWGWRKARLTPYLPTDPLPAGDTDGPKS